MLIAALVMAVIGLVALVTAVVTGSEVIAWACIGASVVGVVLLIIDALRERGGAEATRAARDDHKDDNHKDDDHKDDDQDDDKARASESDEDAYDAEYPETPAYEEVSEVSEAPEEPTEKADEVQASDSETTR
jgi:hypothetical protein